MNKVVLVGAGFSKGVAQLPITMEWFDSWQALVPALPKSWQPIAIDVLHEIRHFEKRRLSQVIQDAEVVKNYTSDFTKKIEKLFLLLDTVEDLKFEGYSVANDTHYTFDDLSIVDVFRQRADVIKLYFMRLLMVSLSRDSIDPALAKAFIKENVGVRTYISLNYDVVLEKILYSLTDQWWPAGGYGNSFMCDPARGFSPIQVLKPHGALCWRKEMFSSDASSGPIVNHLEDNGGFVLRDPYGRPFFAKSLSRFDEHAQDANFPPSSFDPRDLVLPTMSKAYADIHRSQIQQMFDEISKADEVQVIGYRIPPEDEVIFSTIRLALGLRGIAKLTLIDPNAVAIKASIEKDFRSSVQIDVIPKYIQDHLAGI
jgi:hypothetical protein